MPVISQRGGRKGIHWEMFPCLERNDTKCEVVLEVTYFFAVRAKDRLGHLKLWLAKLI